MSLKTRTIKLRSRQAQRRSRVPALLLTRNANKCLVNLYRINNNRLAPAGHREKKKRGNHATNRLDKLMGTTDGQQDARCETCQIDRRCLLHGKSLADPKSVKHARQAVNDRDAQQPARSSPNITTSRNYR